MELSKDKIIELQQNRDPYLMIDHVTDYEPGKYAKGYKDLNDDWFFKVLAIRPKYAWYASGGGTCSNVIDGNCNHRGKFWQNIALVNADKLQFKKIIPGDRLELNTNILSFKRGTATHRRRFS